MRYIADFHIHSKYSRATSKDMDLEHLDKWAKIKGIDILGTGDFTHPEWFNELKTKLESLGNGLFRLKQPTTYNLQPTTYFILTTELSCIYSKGGKVRRIHILIFAPDLATVEKINTQLGWSSNLKSDGRPILGMDAEELAKIVFDASENTMVIPAHAWTPWFSIFGSKSGFDSIEECFGKLTPYIYSIETGLSSDPAMNWRLSALDKITLISNSDAHSPKNLGREANVFEGEKIDYNLITKAIKLGGRDDKCPVIRQGDGLKLVKTIEFFPEEGKYHWDGHRACDIRFSPEKTKKYNGICPVCGKPLTRGVLARVGDLADREAGVKPAGAIDYKRLVPLPEIIAESFGVGKQSKRVMTEYQNLISQGKNEFNILLNLSKEELEQITQPKIVKGILRVRQGQVNIQPGYDGVYGTVSVFGEAGTAASSKVKQQTLF